MERLRTEAERIEAAKRAAIANGNVLITTLGAAYLYGRELNTVKQARKKNPHAVRLIVGFSNKPTPLIDYDWAEARWGSQRDPDRYAEMYGHGLTMNGYLILHSEDILQIPRPPGSNINTFHRTTADWRKQEEGLL